MTFASFQAGKLYVKDTPCIVEVGSKKDPFRCQLFRMEGFSKDLKALVTGRFTTYQKTKPKRQKNVPIMPAFLCIGPAECAERLSPPPPALAGEQCVLNFACSSCQTAQIKITRTFCPIPNSTSFTSISTPLKLPPAAPLIPPGLPKWVRVFRFCRPSVELLSFLVDFSHIPKLIKNQRPPKT